jgi:hypothetical protein
MRLTIALFLIAACSAPDQPVPSPHDITIDALGVSITVIGDWKLRTLDASTVQLISGPRYVTLRQTNPFATVEDARRNLGDAKIHQERKLLGGGYLFIYDNSPAGGASSKILSVQLPVGNAAVECATLFALAMKGDEELLTAICASMRVQ